MSSISVRDLVGDSISFHQVLHLDSVVVVGLKFYDFIIIISQCSAEHSVIGHRAIHSQENLHTLYDVYNADGQSGASQSYVSSSSFLFSLLYYLFSWKKSVTDLFYTYKHHSHKIVKVINNGYRNWVKTWIEPASGLVELWLVPSRFVRIMVDAPTRISGGQCPLNDNVTLFTELKLTDIILKFFLFI